MSTFAVFMAFKAFGDIIDIVRITANEMKITFKASEAVSNLKNQHFISIEKNNVVVEFIGEHSMKAKKVHVTDTLLEPPSRISPANILNALNDDCLRTIFESNVLEVYDYGAIASVCTRFNQIIHECFPSKCNGIDKRLNTFYDRKRSIEMWQLDGIFHHFGTSIIELNLNRFPMQPVLLGIITEYCKNLTCLTWEVSEQSMIHELRPLASRLKELHLTLRMKNGAVMDLNELFNPSNIPLKTLALCLCYNQLKLPTICNMPNLLHLHLDKVHLMDKTATEAFLLQHSHLEKLTINNSEFDFDINYVHNDPSSPVNYRYRKWNRLMEFSCFGHLTNLRALHLENNVTGPKCIIQALRNANVQLEFLSIKNPWRLFKAIDEICLMTSIQFLDIELNHEDQMIRLVRNLINLNGIAIKSDAITIDGIKQVLDEASGKLVKASFVINKHWEDHPFVGDTDNHMVAISEIAERRSIDVEIVIKARYYGILVSICA